MIILVIKKEGNPDFINHLKNMSNQKSEIELVEDFVKVCEILTDDIKYILKKEKVDAVFTMPRAKRESYYKQSQLMFKKTVSSVTRSLKIEDCTNSIQRIKDTKVTHNWRMDNNSGSDPYPNITKDTCKLDSNSAKGKDILLIDDIYTKGVNVIEDCVQFLFDNGAKDVIVYVIAKTKEK